MRAWVVLGFVAACASDPPKPPKTAVTEPEPFVSPPPPSASSPTPTQTTPTNCIIVQGEYGGQPSVVEGTLSKNEKKSAGATLVLRLTHPRCIVGLARATYVAEVYVATTGTDLRPFIDSRVRITGDVVGGTTDMGGAAVVILAKDVERLASSTNGE